MGRLRVNPHHVVSNSAQRLFALPGKLFALIMVGALLLSACGGSAAPTPEAPAAPAAPAATAAPAASEATAAPAAEPTAAPAEQPAEQPAAEKVLRVGINVPPGDFNPFTASNAFQYWVLSLVMSQLTVADTDALAAAPSLADSWEVAPDATSVTFKLNPNAKWHDGTPVTAKDVAFTFRMALHPEVKSNRASAYALIKGAAAFTAGEADDVEGITVIDDHTIRFDMEFPNGLFVDETAQRAQILPEHLLGNVPPAELSQNRFFIDGLVGSGPFKLEKFVTDQYAELVAYPDYFGGKPKIDRILVSIIKSHDAMQVALQRGELDFVVTDGGPLPLATYQEFLNHPNFKVVATGGGPVLGYGFNHRLDYLSDPRLHQAFLYAIDRKKILQTLLGGVGSLPNSFMVHPWFQKPEWNDLYAYDPEKAKALLAEMGWDSNRELTVNVLPIASEDDRAILAAQQQMLGDVGIKINFQELEASVWVERFYTNHDYELVYVTFGTFPDPDGFLYWHMHSTSQNALGYANPELDAKIEAGRRAATQEQRIPIYQEITEEVLQTVPIAPIYRQNFLFILSRNWSIPQVDTMQEVTSLDDLGPGKRLFSDFDAFLYRPELWDLK